MIRAYLLFIAASVALAGCGDPIGSACSIRGSGFTASNDCRNKCLMYKKIRCPDGSRIAPKVCSGKESCTTGGCPSGQICYFEDDGTDETSYCVLAETCGVQSDDSLAQWEQDSFTIAEETRRAWSEKFKNHSTTETTELPK